MSATSRGTCEIESTDACGGFANDRSSCLSFASSFTRICPTAAAAAFMNTFASGGCCRARLRVWASNAIPPSVLEEGVRCRAREEEVPGQRQMRYTKHSQRGRPMMGHSSRLYHHHLYVCFHCHPFSWKVLQEQLDHHSTLGARRGEAQTGLGL